MTPKQILHSDVVQTEILDPLRNKLGSKAIEISRSQFERNLPDRCKNVAIAAVLPHPDEKSYITHDSSENVQHMLKELLSDPDHPLEQNFTPELITPNPPIHFSDTDFYFCFPSELKRMHLLWDTTSGVGERQADGSNAPNEPISPELELRILVDKSLRSPLTLKQQHALTTHLAESPTRVLDAGLTPQAFPDLVEHSPMLAIEVLRALIRTDRFTEYLTVLVNMEMSVHSMEVVKLLTAEVDLPTDLIVLYLCNCMSTCEQNKDQYTQNRLVRLFCVFLQSLVKNNTIHLEDISIELQCFCIQFCAFKEVSALYRMLKNKGKPEDVPSTSGQLSLDCAAKDSNSSNSNLSSPSS